MAADWQCGTARYPFRGRWILRQSEPDRSVGATNGGLVNQPLFTGSLFSGPVGWGGSPNGRQQHGRLPAGSSSSSYSASDQLSLRFCMGVGSDRDPPRRRPGTGPLRRFPLWQLRGTCHCPGRFFSPEIQMEGNRHWLRIGGNVQIVDSCRPSADNCRAAAGELS